MKEAVIISTARTPIGKAYRGAFNATPGASLGLLASTIPLVKYTDIIPTDVSGYVTAISPFHSDRAISLASG